MGLNQVSAASLARRSKGAPKMIVRIPASLLVLAYWTAARIALRAAASSPAIMWAPINEKRNAWALEGALAARQAFARFGARVAAAGTASKGLQSTARLPQPDYCASSRRCYAGGSRPLMQAENVTSAADCGEVGTKPYVASAIPPQSIQRKFRAALISVTL
jgi:hypothetical protein